MTREEFRLQAYLACLPAVADRLIKANFPQLKNQEIGSAISSLAGDIADQSVLEMKDFLTKDPAI